MTAAGAVWLAERNIRVRAKRRFVANHDAAREATDAEVERVEVRAMDGTPLRAWLLHNPEKWSGRAALVLHGFVDTRAAMLQHAAMLLRQGFAVLAPDSRGHGESGGREVTFGLRESADVRTWGDWLCTRLGVESFVGLGQSMGACVLLHALPIEARLEAVIAEFPFTSFSSAAYDKLADRYGLPRRFTQHCVSAHGRVGVLVRALALRRGHASRSAGGCHSTVGRAGAADSRRRGPCDPGDARAGVARGERLRLLGSTARGAHRAVPRGGARVRTARCGVPGG
ncbi:MAG: alpha/beta hydrolase [Acidobacteria bacterium]|nr:alpha/beta hydrolase [Acidobacteriota bacterium]